MHIEAMLPFTSFNLPLNIKKYLFMKRIHIMLMAIAVMAGVFSAYADTRKQSCLYKQQFYKFGFWYLPAGQYGTQYYCLSDIGICTYYQPDPLYYPHTYYPCRFGLYTTIIY